jgi:hypothetical protein
MSCADFDWKAYSLGEMSGDERRDAEKHAASCAGCRDELSSTRLTLDALSTLREEEVPRRIAFVSDKVFEPRWWTRVRQSFLHPSFAAAAVIAAAILVHAFVRTEPALDSATMQARIEASVNKAVAETEERHARELENVLANYEFIQKQDRLDYIRNTGLVRQ